MKDRKDGRDGKGKGNGGREVSSPHDAVGIAARRFKTKNWQHTGRQTCASLTHGKHTNELPKSKKTDKRKTDHPPSEHKIETLKHS